MPQPKDDIEMVQDFLEDAADDAAKLKKFHNLTARKDQPHKPDPSRHYNNWHKSNETWCNTFVDVLNNEAAMNALRQSTYGQDGGRTK